MYSTEPPSGVSLSGTIFTGPDNGSYFLQSGQTTVNGRNLTALFGGSDSGAAINVATPVGENAILLAVGNTSAPLTLTLSDGETFAVSGGFFGLSISHTITSFTLATAGGQQPILWGLDYGVSNLTQDGSGGGTGGGTGGTGGANTPEGSTIALLGGGLIVLCVCHRKWSSQTTNG